MKLLIVILGSFLYISAAFSQKDTCHNCTFDDKEEILEEQILGIPMNAENLPFPQNDYYSHWNQGVIYLSDNDSITSRIFRYDGFTDNILLMSNAVTEKIAAEKLFINGFKIKSITNNNYYLFRKIKISDYLTLGSQETFLQVMIEGKISFYAYRKLSKSVKSNDLTFNYIYYIKTEKGQFHSFLKPTRRILLGLFPNNKKNLRSELRKAKIKIKDEDSMVRAIALINSMKD